MAQEAAFGRWLKQRRRSLDLTQEELAARVDCAPETIRKLEAGGRRPSKEIAQRLADALDIAPAERTAFVQVARSVPLEEPLPLPGVPTSGTPNAAPAGAVARLKDYVVYEQLGAGSFGVVYRAAQLHLGREVAIKVIRPPYTNDLAFIRRFETEAQLVAQLEHPHIVPLYDYWREPGGAYLVMRYIAGGSLRTALRAGPLSLGTALPLFQQIAAGLIAAHRQGVIHRDLKPENILLDDAGNAYLADFGIAQVIAVHSAAADTFMADDTPGSSYRAPEQLRNEPITPRTDIYSLGLVLAEMLTTQPPDPGAGPDVPRADGHAAGHPAVSTSRPVLPPALDGVLQRATASRPDDRYADVAELLAAVLDATHTAPQLVGAAAPVATPAAVRVAPGDQVTVPNPYKGLRAFGEPDAPDFFGREQIVQDLLQRLMEDVAFGRFLAVVGPSGSGKSSVVKAGLIPALRRGDLPGSEHWLVIDVLPGAYPFDELEAALLRIAVNPPPTLLEQLEADSRGVLRAVDRTLPPDPATELVLMTDQFEEVFTLVADETVRVRFLESLHAAVTAPRSRLRLIITLRADFYDRPLHYAGFNALIRQRTAVLVPLTADEVQLAIAGPAARVGYSIEAGAIAAMQRDVAAQPGALPLLEYALTELFERRHGAVMTLAAYQESGGVLGATARRADELYAGLDPVTQTMARQVFLRLVTLGEGTEDTRRRVRRTELAALADDTHALQTVLDTYGRYRLLTFDHDTESRTPTVELAHEALIRAWSRLRTWIDASRDDVRLHRRLQAATAEWAQAQHDESFLARGARLQQFAALADESAVALNADESTYLAASLAEQDRQADAERDRHARELTLVQESAAAAAQAARAERSAAGRLRALAGVLALFLIVAAVLSAVAFSSRAAAVRSLALSESQRLASEANGVLQRQESAELAALLALRGLGSAYTPQADVALQRAAGVEYGERLFPHPSRVLSVVFAPDGRSLATTTAGDGVVRLWDVMTGQEVRQFVGHHDRAWSVAFSPDGTQLVSGGRDQTARLWDRETGQELRRFEHPGEVGLVTFVTDGTSVWVGGLRSVARRWDTRTGALLQELQVGDQGILAVSRDGTLLLTGAGDGHVQVWDTRTGEVVRSLDGHTAELTLGQFSPDGHYVLTASWDKTSILWDLTTGQPVHTFAGHTETVFQAVLAPDGKHVLTGSLDTTARLWDTESGQEVERFMAHTGTVETVAFSPDGHAIATGSGDGSVRLWNLEARHAMDTLAGQTGLIMGLAFSPDGTKLLTGSSDRTAVLWDVGSGTQLRVFPLLGRADSAAFSPDGRHILVAPAYGGSAQVFDVQSGAEVQRFDDSGGVRGVAYSPDGMLLVTGSATTVTVRTADTGHIIRTITVLDSSPSWYLAIALSPDGKTLATGTIAPEGERVRLWDIDTGRPLRGFADPSLVNTVAFSPDGKYLLSGGQDNTARLWDVATGKVVRTFVGHTFWIWDVDFSPDGRTVLTASQDKTARLWEVATGQQVRVFLGHANAPVASAGFAPDGRSVAIGSFDGSIQRARADLPSLIASVCARVLRDFTAEERTIYGITGTAPTCPEQ